MQGGHTRRRYHWAVKIAKRHAVTCKEADLLAAAQLGDLGMMKVLKKSLSKKRSNQSVPICF